MSAEEVDRLRAMFDAFWRDRNWNAGRGFLAPDVEWLNLPEGIDESVRGVTGIDEYFESFLRVWREMEVDYGFEDLGGGHIVVENHWRGLGRASGAPSQMRFFQLWTIKDGMAVRVESFRTAEEARAAATLS